MILVILESPYAGDVELNTMYARACTLDCLNRGEAPMVSHLLYTQEGILDDLIPRERTLGIEAGLAWGPVAEKTVVYTDLGMSPEMKGGVDRATGEGRPIEYRTLPGWVEKAKELRKKRDSDIFWDENGFFIYITVFVVVLMLLAILSKMING